MPGSSNTAERSLRILHVFRSPVGGLFRHVVDLAGEQVRQGHDVGLVVDGSTGGERAERILGELRPTLSLGLHRFAMRRDPHPADAAGLWRTARIAAAARPDVLHGHGSKGALYARLADLLPSGPAPVRAYTPHGGSLHFAPGSLKGRLVLGTERLLARRTDLLLFESLFAADRFRALVGSPRGLTRVVLNGVTTAEFAPVATAAGAADFVFVGELRHLKGIDLMLRAMAGLRETLGRTPTAVLVGEGPDRDSAVALAAELGLAEAVRFAGAMPARDAFALGDILVVPSRAESLPYVVLEAAGARRPMVTTRVGGIPEIFGPYGDRLVPGGDALALQAEMGAMVREGADARARRAADLAAYVRTNFSVARMVEGVMNGYRDAVALKGRQGRAALRPGLFHTQRSGS